MANEAELATKFGITTVPISPTAIAKRADELIAENGGALKAYYADLTARIDTSAMEPDKVLRCAAVAMATKQLMLENNCSVGAMECWSADADHRRADLHDASASSPTPACRSPARPTSTAR